MMSRRVTVPPSLALEPTLAKIPQATLGEMIGATRSSVNVSLNKFRKLGLIEYTASGHLVIHKALLSVVLHY